MSMQLVCGCFRNLLAGDREQTVPTMIRRAYQYYPGMVFLASKFASITANPSFTMYLHTVH